MKRTRFSCENCHHEVKPNAKVCPYCGKFFTAVRCPKCTYVGEARDFVHGCPNCGYAGDTPGQSTGFEQVNLGGTDSPGKRKSGTPGWVYPLAAGIIVLVFAALVLLYLNL